jgi:hypothetical protein
MGLDFSSAIKIPEIIEVLHVRIIGLMIRGREGILSLVVVQNTDPS